MAWLTHNWAVLSATCQKITAQSLTCSWIGIQSTLRNLRLETQYLQAQTSFTRCSHPLKKTSQRRSVYLPSSFQRAKNFRLYSCAPVDSKTKICSTLWWLWNQTQVSTWTETWKCSTSPTTTSAHPLFRNSAPSSSKIAHSSSWVLPRINWRQKMLFHCLKALVESPCPPIKSRHTNLSSRNATPSLRKIRNWSNKRSQKSQSQF